MQLVLFTAVLQGCALPLDVELSSPEVEKARRVVRLPDGRPIEVLRAIFRVKGMLNNPYDTTVVGYKCNGDQSTDSVGAGTVALQDGVAFLDFLEERPGNRNLREYNMKKNSFDVCIYISVFDYPFRRESNTIRIPADRISQIID